MDLVIQEDGPQKTVEMKTSQATIDAKQSNESSNQLQEAKLEQENLDDVDSKTMPQGYQKEAFWGKTEKWAGPILESNDL